MATNNKRNNSANTVKQQPDKTETAPVIEESKPERKPVARDVDLNQYITVRNGFQGKLIYKSSRTGETFIWDEFGAEQEIELRELVNAKNSSKKFFINNWFMFDDGWVIDFLGIRQFYKNAVSIEDFDGIFKKSADEIKSIVSQMSAGQKRSAAYRARQLIAEGEIDSNKAITALEETLGIELVER